MDYACPDRAVLLEYDVARGFFLLPKGFYGFVFELAVPSEARDCGPGRQRWGAGAHQQTAPTGNSPADPTRDHDAAFPWPWPWRAELARLDSLSSLLLLVTLHQPCHHHRPLTPACDTAPIIVCAPPSRWHTSPAVALQNVGDGEGRRPRTALGLKRSPKAKAATCLPHTRACQFSPLLLTPPSP